jgi:hypothetical protein
LAKSMIENTAQILLANAQRENRKGPSLRLHNRNQNKERSLKNLLGNKILPFASLFFFSILGAKSSSAQVIVVQAPAMACNNSNSCTVVFSNPVASGDTVWLVTDFVSVTPLSVVDSLQNSYTISANVVSSPDGTWKQVAAWSQTASPGSLSVTVNLTGSSPFMEMYAFDIRGGTLDSQTSGTGPAGSISVPIIDGSAGEVNVAAIVSGGSANPGTGFMVSSNLNGNLSEWAAFANPGTYNITATSNAVWAMNAASFKPPAGTGGSAPVITTQPSNTAVAVSQTATFSVVAAGTAPLSYQWQKNGTNITGATSASYTTPSTASTDNGATFQVVVSNSAGSVTSGAATLTVNPAVVAPTIKTQPANQTVTAGQTATFSVVAAGTAPLSYQWQKNGTNITGATSASYTTPSTASTDNGSTFQVVVSNSAGSVTSGAATLTVNPAVVAPTITTQPANQTVTAGQTATFSAVAAGTAPLSYQWQKNGANITGATSASYTTPSTASTDNGSTFQVVVSNSAGSVTSSAATLTVNPAVVAPTITTQPANQTVTAGQTATFSAVAAGTASLSYQWHKNGANITGATSASYTTPSTASTDNGSTFQVVVSNTAGSVTSTAATLTVNATSGAPVITQQPQSQTVQVGQSAIFSVVISNGPCRSIWYINGAAHYGAFASTISYTIPNTTSAMNGWTVVVNLYGCGSTGASLGNSQTAILTVTPATGAPTITTQPANQTVTAGQTATFSVVAAGTAPLSYQWQKNGTNITGATSATYTTPSTASTDNGSMFQVVASNSAGSVTSSAATLTVNPAVVAPTITTQPANQTVTAGQTATFSLVAAGTAPLSYQWQKNGTNIAGATSSSYTTPATAASDNGSTFDVVVSNSASSVTSAAATLTVNVPPSITTQPVSQTVTLGQTATFSVVAAGTAPLSYQWQKNGSNIAGATSASYKTPSTTSADNGSTFKVLVSNSVGNVTSNTATLTVNAAAVAPTITTQPVNQTVTAGQTAAFSVVAAGTAPLNYQWQKNGANITGATSAGYTTPATTTSDSGATFKVVVSNSAGSTTSNAATLTVNSAQITPSITTQPASQTVSVGQTATFTVAATGAAPLSYQWSNNGTAISGASSSSYTTPATTSSDNGDVFQVTVSNSSGSVTSGSAVLTIVSAQLANATVTLTTTGQQIPSNFGGISLDFFDAQTFVPNPLYPQLIKNLAFPGQKLDLNVEGDGSPWPGTPTSAQIAIFNNLYTTLEASGVSLRFTLPAPMCPSATATTYATPAVASYIANAGAGWLGVTLGNEPDGACQNSGSYAGGYATFKTNWDAFRTAITSLSGGSGLKFAGPSFGGQQPWNDASDLNSFVNGEAANLPYVSQHWYPQNGCSGSPSLSAELAAAQAKPSDTNYASYVANAHKDGVPFRISEMNDIDCSGRSGISDTFAAALWLPDALFHLANVGTDGVDVISDSDGFYDLLELPSPSTCTLNVTTGCILRPNYYGFYMFQEATQNGAKLLPVSTTTSANVSIWATIDTAGIVRVVVLNKDETHSGTVNITLAGYGSASLKTLSAASVTATTGVSYGGQTFDGSTDGTIQGTLSTPTVTPTSGVYTFTIAPTSAALLTVAP